MSIQLVLASQSPRRKELLQQLGYTFDCVPANIDEAAHINETPDKYVSRVALEKAQCIALQQTENTVVLGSDTSVVFEEHILGKPESLEDCISMLSMLSGQKHQVLTAVAAMQGSRAKVLLVSTDVYFKELSKNEIIRYWHTGEPQDKAGAYGIQGIAGQFVTKIMGSYSAVVGLPLYETAELLSMFNLTSSLTHD